MDQPRHKLMFWMLCVLMTVGLLTGCDSGQSPPAQSMGQTPSANQILFKDDFSNVPSTWGTWERDGGVITYEQGGLRILVNKPNFDFWSVAGKQFQDITIDVDVTRLAGPEDNDFGVICRYLDGRNFYMFLVSSDGYYGIAKVKNDQRSLIGIEQLKYTDRIQSGQTAHQLRATCVGSTLALTVDGELLLTAQDTDFTSGDVGVLAGAYSTPGVDILFDNFEVRQGE
jgi:hypothetical protein